jgi:hypothetical protein
VQIQRDNLERNGTMEEIKYVLEGLFLLLIGWGIISACLQLVIGLIVATFIFIAEHFRYIVVAVIILGLFYVLAEHHNEATALRLSKT